jgi:hypothetical protein
MSLLFYTDLKNNVVLRRDCVDLCPELKLINDKELLFIILVYDYHSIYRQFPERQRLSRAIFHVFGDNVPNLLDPEKHPQKIKIAIDSYRSLQYDPNVELIDLYNRKIQEQMSILEEDKSTIGIKNASENIDRFRKLIRAIESEVIESTLMEGKLSGKMELSFLERFKSNQKMYRASTAKRG